MGGFMASDTLKTQICDALAAFIRQRPGLDPNNYFNPADSRIAVYRQGVAAYHSEARSIARDKRDAETLLQAVRGRESITADMIIEAAKRGFSGRLTITVTDVMSEPEQIAPGKILERAPLYVTGHKIGLDYCTGQYWPTEYRKAVAAVCAAALWAYMRDNMPQADGTADHDGDGAYDGMSAGDWLRRNARREFGSKLQRRWFN